MKLFSKKKFISFTTFEQERKLVLQLREFETQLAQEPLQAVRMIPYLLELLSWIDQNNIDIQWYRQHLKTLQQDNVLHNIEEYIHQTNTHTWSLLEKFGIIPREENFYLTYGDKTDSPAEVLPIHIVLVELRSPFNLGSVIRNASFFNIHSIHLINSAINPSNQRVQKVAKTNSNSPPLLTYQSFEDFLKFYKNQPKCSLWGIETSQTAKPIEQLAIPEDRQIFLMFGNEEYGLTPQALKQCDQVYQLQRNGMKHSLNISSMTSIVLYECSKNFINQ